MKRRVSDIWRSTLKGKALTRYLLTNVVSGVVVDVSGDCIVHGESALKRLRPIPHTTDKPKAMPRHESKFIIRIHTSRSYEK